MGKFIFIILSFVAITFASVVEKKEKLGFVYGSTKAPVNPTPKPTTKPNPNPTPKPTTKPNPQPAPTPGTSCVKTFSVGNYNGQGNKNSPTAALTSATTSNFATDCLIAHNYYRIRHGVPEMTQDPKLNAAATVYAQYLAANNIFQHSSADSRDNQGENLFQIGGGGIPCGNVATDYWYDENHYYDYDNPPDNDPTRFVKVGHFTQVIWKTSALLGCGFATKNGKTWVVARYSPGGNIQGAFVENVPKPKP